MLSKKLLLAIALVGLSLNLPTIYTTPQTAFAQTPTSVRSEFCDCGRPACATCSKHQPTPALTSSSSGRQFYTLDSSHLAPARLQYEDYPPAITDHHGSYTTGNVESTGSTVYQLGDCQSGDCVFPTEGCQSGGCQAESCQSGTCRKPGCLKDRTPRASRAPRAPRTKSCRKCPKCLNDVCTLKVEKGKEKKTCYETEQKIICIPKVRLPWQNCNPDNPAPTCSETRTVTLLKKKKYECDVCKYSWKVVEPAVPDVSHLQGPKTTGGEARKAEMEPEEIKPINDIEVEQAPQEPIVPGAIPKAPPIPKESGLRFRIFK